MGASEIIFYLLAIMTLFFGALSVTAKHIFRAAIYLLFSLISVAGIYFWMEYEFIAAVQVVVYVGGIVVLIIFSIVLTQQSGEALPEPVLGRKVLAALATFCGFSLLVLQILKHQFPAVKFEEIPSKEIQSIGQQLMDIDQYGWALPFEVISILLLAALIGCIVIALKLSPEKEK